MAKIQEVLAKHGVENAELIAELETVIQTAESKNTGDGIPYSRFKEKVSQYNNAVADNAELKTQLEQLNEKLNQSATQIGELSKYKTEFENVQKQKFEKNLEKWNSSKEIFNVAEGDKIFEKVAKVKHRFNLADDLTPDQIQSNLAMLDTYNEVGYFNMESKPTGYTDAKPNSEKLKGDFYGYDSPQQLAWKDPKLYEKWKSEQK